MQGIFLNKVTLIKGDIYIMTGQNNRGGKREGAGRKAIGVTRKVSLTLPTELWSEIEFLCEYDGGSQSKVIRKMLEAQIPKTQMVRDIKELQNANIGANITSDEDAVDFCVKLVHEIFMQKKHKDEPDLK
ncbi:CopG family transcriptional regulator [Bacillus sp. TH25]|nr:CopG family transcriptional regulator [Bacillus sp. TH25]